MKRKFKYLFLHAIFESRNHKSFLFSFIAVVFFIWLLGFEIDLVWQNGGIEKSLGSNWFGGTEDDYKLGFSITYFSILLFSIFFSTGIIHQNLKRESLSLWLVKPISRRMFAFILLGTSAIMIWTVFTLFHLLMWVVLGLRYGIWLSGFGSALAIIFLYCFILSCIVFLFSLISKRSASSVFYGLCFVILLPFGIPVIENSMSTHQGIGKGLLFVLETVSPMIIDGLSEMSNIIFNNTYNLADLPQSLVIGTLSLLGSILIFERKSF